MAINICNRINTWFNDHLVTPLHEMTWTERIVLLLFGFWFGIFPVPGLSTPILIFGFVIVNRYALQPLAVSETTVATAVNLLATPFCIALIPFWMQLGSILFGLGNRCNAKRIIDEFSEDGFFVTVGKFAGCIGAAAFAWIAVSPFVVSTLMIVRSRVRRFTAEEQLRTNGEFVVLGNDVDIDEDRIERGSYNRTRDRLPLSMYHRLDESSELKPLTPQDRVTGKAPTIDD